jgi:hypothetical protein
MYLYFYEAKMIAGFIPINGMFPFAKKIDDFGLNNSFHWFTGWETEKNDDGTFYLVFIMTENLKYYLEKSMNHDPHDILRMVFDDKQYAQKFVFNDDETIMCYNDDNTNNYKYTLHPKQTSYGDFYLSDSYYDNDGNLVDYSFENNGSAVSNKVCLTETLDLNSYVLK